MATQEKKDHVHDVTLYEDIAKVQEFVSDQAQCRLVDVQGWTILHHFIAYANAAKHNIPELLNILLKEDYDYLNDKTATGSYPVHMAVPYSQVAILDAILKQRPDQCWLQDSLLNNPLHYAVGSQWYVSLPRPQEMIESLLKAASSVHSVSKIINMPNQAGLTPLHLTVKNGDKLTTTYRPFNRIIPLYEDKEDLEPLFHYMSSFDCGPNTDRHAMLKKAAEHMPLKDTLNKRWGKTGAIATTPLENAAINRQPNTLKAFLDLNGVIINLRDSNGEKRNEMFYAAMNGETERGNECVNTLLDNCPEFGGYERAALFEEEDVNGRTVFYYVQKNCTYDMACSCNCNYNCKPVRATTVTKMLDIVFGSNSSYTQRKQTFNDQFLQKCFKDNPEIVGYLLGKSVYYLESSSTNQQAKLHYDVSAVTGVTNITKQPSQGTEHKYDMETPQTENLRNCISHWSEAQKRDILLHPVTKFFLFEKYKRNRTPIIFLLAVQTLWIINLALFAAYAFQEKQGKWFLASIPLFLYSIVSICYEINEGYRCREYYWSNFTNYVQIARSFLIGVSAVQVFFQFQEAAKPFAAVGIVLAYVLAMRHFRNLGKTVGQTIDILRQVCTTVLSVLLSCTLILFGFTQALVLLFTESGTATSIAHIETLNISHLVPFYKVLAMMSGELEFNKIGTNLVSGIEAELTWTTAIARNLIFLFFFVGIVLAFFNQLTGVALDKVKELHDGAEVQRVVSKIEYIYFLENLMGFLFKITNLFDKKLRTQISAWWRSNDRGTPPSSLETGPRVLIASKLSKLETWFVQYDVTTYDKGTGISSDLIPVDNGVTETAITDNFWKSWWDNFPDLDQPSNHDFRAMHTLAEMNPIVNTLHI